MTNRPPKRRKPDTYEVVITATNAAGTNSSWEFNIPVAKYNRFWLDLDDLIKQYSANPL